MTMGKATGRPHAAMYLLAHAVVLQAITFAMRPTVSYAVLDVGGSQALLGVVVAAFAVPALILALPAGHVIDRTGERASLLAGAAALVMAALLAIFGGGSVGVLLLATMFLGIGHLLSVIGEQAIVANTTSRGQYDSKFGHFTFASALGQTIGPLLLALPGGTPETPPVAVIFVVCGALGAVLLGISFLVPGSVRHAAAAGERVRMLPAAAGLLRTPGLVRALVAGSLVLASVDLFLAYLPALGHQRGIAAVVVSAMLVARSMFSMFSRLFLGPMVRLLGRRRLMVWTIGVSAAALLLFALPLHIAVLLALAAVYGFAIGTCQPITMSWIAELATPGTRGLAMSLRLASNRLGQTVLPSLLGALSAATGAAGVFVATGIMLAGGAWSGAAVGHAQSAEEDGDDEPARA
ncbi:MFS transporter [Arthrobacter sp. SDTb3-6]|uniref:MFS transporter n=1 Tax=Arthrobacter sp. SDTb3-6 TaxID=2713571 RepID=UPI00210A38A2|nr:MFS transporter [Arthrobacter sp. SDTb3-6]